MSASTTAPQIHTKIYFSPGTQVRRLRIEPNTTLDEFKQQLKQLHEASPVFKIGQYVYSLSYQDEEGDWVLVDTQEEWQEALNGRKSSSDLMRIKFTASNKSLQTINKCRKEYQQAVTDQYNSNVRPLIQQLKEYLKDPEKQNEAKQWLKELTNKIGDQAHNGFNQVQNRVDQWLKDNEVPQKVEYCMHEFDAMADTLADRVEEIKHKLIPSVTDDEADEIAEMNDELLAEANIQLNDEYHLLDDQVNAEENIAEPEPVEEEEVVPVEEVKPAEPEFTVPPEFADQFRSLQDMGFTDKQLNLRLLKENKGDIVKVVSALLNFSL